MPVVIWRFVLPDGPHNVSVNHTPVVNNVYVEGTHYPSPRYRVCCVANRAWLCVCVGGWE